MKTYGLASIIAPRIRDARGLVSVAPQPLYPPGRSLQYSFVKGWVGPTSDLVIVLSLPVNEPRLLRHPTCNLVNIPYIRAIRTNRMHYLLSIYFDN
jgi:hypothetical protein